MTCKWQRQRWSQAFHLFPHSSHPSSLALGLAIWLLQVKEMWVDIICHIWDEGEALCSSTVSLFSSEEVKEVLHSWRHISWWCRLCRPGLLRPPPRNQPLLCSAFYIEGLIFHSTICLPCLIQSSRETFTHVQDDHSSAVSKNKNDYATQMPIDKCDIFFKSQYINTVKYYTSIEYIATIIMYEF